MQKSKIFFLLIILTLGLNIQAQDKIDYLDDGGYSQISNYISVDLFQLATPAIVLKYEHLFGKKFIIGGGVKYLLPDHEYVFNPDLTGLYALNDHKYFAEGNGLNFFAEVKGNYVIKDSRSLRTGLGYRLTLYDIAKMQDIYLTSGFYFHLNMHLFFSLGIETGLRIIDYTDIEYDPPSTDPKFLKNYEEDYNNSIHKMKMFFLPSIGFGLMW